ncbi:MAG: hypothetical protein AAB544_05565 [Patescibacteria group bacterium]
METPKILTSFSQLNYEQFEQKLAKFKEERKKEDEAEFLLYRMVAKLVERKYPYDQLQYLDVESLEVLSYAEFHMDGVVGVLNNDISHLAHNLFVDQHAQTLHALRSLSVAEGGGVREDDEDCRTIE